MRRFRAVLGLALGVAVLAGCERAGRDAKEPSADAARAAAFRHAFDEDVSGEYRPVAPARQGGWRVASLYVGQETAFQAWEAGDRDHAPLQLTLEGPEGTVVVLPTRYGVTDQALDMEGRTADGRTVRFSARIDVGALATARRNLGDQAAVVAGRADIDGVRAPVALTWWGGD